MDVSQYLEIFLDESNEHLQTLSDQLIILEKEPDVLLPLRHDPDGGLSLPADERRAGTAGLVRSHLRLRHPAADAGLPF